jgi:16S rRNA (cytidine1402-2'-O)-methyltransferase
VKKYAEQPSVQAGVLYVVATPIGNLSDISERALQVLRSVDYIAAEDTRHTARLLRHFGIKTAQISCHEHNERERIPKLLNDLQQGKAIALVSDAGTPLLSDPGFPLLRALRSAGLCAVPVPGPSSVTAALSVAGLATDRFAFEGFLPAKSGARQARLEALKKSPYTLVLLESSHRIQATIADLVTIFGDQREACIARELTKQFEEVRTGTLAVLSRALCENPESQRGEFVIVVAAAELDPLDDEARRVLYLLLEELPLKRAVIMAAKISHVPKNTLYALALEWQNNQSPC